MAQVQYIMVGGFLGAGKTTAILRLAEYFRALGQRVALITNDYGLGLADTTFLEAHGFPVQGIAGGGLGCRFDDLTEAARKLSATAQPDIVLAEPVGSCTDLAATVNAPLRRLHGDSFRIAPLSVLVDPVRAERILGLAPGQSLPPKVIYIYLKQLEEADLVVVNKVETLTDDRLERLTRALKTNFPQAEILAASARHAKGIGEWADRIATAAPPAGESMFVDYDVYADGVALLGRVNLSATLSSPAAFDGNTFAERLMARLAGEFRTGGIEVAHLKATLAPDAGNDLAVFNLTHSEGEPDASRLLRDRIDVGELIVNLRAEREPEDLRALLEGSLAAVAGRMGVSAEVVHAEAFRPGRPAPAHHDQRGIGESPRASL
jgi:Ni2+-binding GTPase involved in maturation of urease and hydrogenase